MDKLEDQPNQGGGCLCGRVRYELKGPRHYGVLCHCDTCRRLTGSAFLAASIYPKDAFKLTQGENWLKQFESNETDSGTPLYRNFCSECGSNVYATTPLFPQIVSVCAGSQDGIQEWKPTMEQYCRNRHVWMGPSGEGGKDNPMMKGPPGGDT